MEMQKLLTADYLDIIYDNRNKDYGGYELRKNYNRRVVKGLASLFLGLAAVSCFSFVKSTPATPKVRIIDNGIHIAKVLPDVHPPRVEPPKPPAPPARPPKSPAFTPPRVATDDLVQNPPPDITAKPGINSTDTAGPENDQPFVDITPSAGVAGGTGVVAIKTDAPAVYCEQMPTFIGDLHDYLAKNCHYPDAARQSGIDGRVVVRFIVNTDGSISDATVLRGIGGGCDEEALRVISAMPRWKNGKQNGKPVRVYFTLPIKFVLQ